MIIDNQIVCVYDIEVFPNIFSCCAYHTEFQRYIILEISTRRNDLISLVKLFKRKDLIFCGYNNKHYDNPIINYILDLKEEFLYSDYNTICEKIYHLSNTIITSDDVSTWKRWKYQNNFNSIDLLTMLFSEKLRVGLKEMEITMNAIHVDEYEGDFSKPLPEQDIDRMLEYNLHDVENTANLLNLCKKDIDLRLGIRQEYGVDVLSMDGVSIGKEILKTKYLQDTGKSWYDIKDLRSPCDMVPLKDVILPIIEFNDSGLKALLNEMKNLVVSPGKDGWNKKFYFHNTKISIGVGGLHSVNEPEMIIPNEDEFLIDTDAASLYPSLLINWGFYPQHLGQEFLDTYSKIKKERIEAKHNNNKVKNETLKLTLNSVTGLMQNEHSWLYAPKDVMRIKRSPAIQ